MKLILHDGIVGIFNQTIQLIHLHNVVEEALVLPLACQWFKLVDDFIQFPREPCLSDSDLSLRVARLTVRATLHPVLPGRNLILHKLVSKLD